MNTKVESGESRMDGLKWLVVLALIIGGAWANSYYADQFEVIYRALALVALGVVICLVAVQTEKGSAFWSLLKEAQVEVRKVVWPTTQETNQTTFLVSVVVVITALLLSVVDWGIGHVAKLVIG